MSVVASLPDLSSVLAYSTQHLTTGASHWENTADQWESSFQQIHTQVQNLPWEGETADAVRERSQNDMLVAVNRADCLREAATAARSGASELQYLKKRVILSIQDAQAAGFDVDEDGSVYDRQMSANAIEEAQRQEMAETFSADIRHRTAALVARDNEVGVDITQRAGDVGVGLFQGGNNGSGRIQDGNYHPGQGRIIAVDNGTDGGAGGGAGGVPGPQPPLPPAQPLPPPAPAPAGAPPPNAVKFPPRTAPLPPTVINAHAGENPQPDPGKHPCPPSQIAKDVTEGVGGPLAVAGSVIGGVAGAPLGPAEWATAISTGLLGIGATIDGFGDLSKCE